MAERMQVQPDQWVYDFLVNGFEMPGGSLVDSSDIRGGNKVKAFRQERIKHMVLGALFEDYGSGPHRRVCLGARHV